MPVSKVASSKAVPVPAPSISFQAILPLTAIGALLLAPPRAQAADLPAPQPGAVSPAHPAPAARPASSGPLDFGEYAFITERLAEWKVVLGGGGLISPKYEGSDEYEVSPVPLVSATFGDVLKVDARGGSAKLFSMEGLTLSGRVGYDLGRQEDDSDRLRGLGDIGAGAVVGARLSYMLGPVELYGAVNRIFGGSDGLEAKFGADASYKYDRSIFTGGVSGSWADGKYMETYFGVTPLQSLTSGLPVYEAGAGLKRMDVTASVTYMLTDHWLIRGQVGLGYLLGDAADSPIVESKTQPSGMIGVGYKF